MSNPAPTLTDIALALVQARASDTFHDMALVHASDAIGMLRIIELNSKAIREQIERAWSGDDTPAGDSDPE